MNNKKTQFVAEVTCYGNGNVGFKPVGTEGKDVLQKDENHDGTLWLKKSGEGEFVKEKKGSGRHRERDVVIRRTVTAALSVSPSGSRVKVNIGLDREEATEDTFVQALKEVIDQLSDVLYEYMVAN